MTQPRRVSPNPRRQGEVNDSQSSLKLVAQYEAGRNEYSLLRHNLTAEEANNAVREIAGLRFGLFVLDQHAEHSSRSPEECIACRSEVEKKAHVKPKPSFKRRQQ